MSLWNEEKHSIAVEAGETLVANRFGKISGSVVVLASAGEVAHGVIMGSASSGEMVRLCRDGVVPVRVGSAITVGQFVKPGASGKAYPIVTSAQDGSAFAFTAGGADELVSVEPLKSMKY